MVFRWSPLLHSTTHHHWPWDMTHIHYSCCCSSQELRDLVYTTGHCKRRSMSQITVVTGRNNRSFLKEMDQGHSFVTFGLSWPLQPKRLASEWMNGGVDKKAKRWKGGRARMQITLSFAVWGEILKEAKIAWPKVICCCIIGPVKISNVINLGENFIKAS